MTAEKRCDCHGEPMRWHKDPRYHAGGYWVCRPHNNEWQRKRYADNSEVRLDRQLRNMCRIR